MAFPLSSNIEDYLEGVVILDNKNRVVRIRDISRKMGVSMPSVNKAMKILSKDGLVNHEKYGYVELTRRGRTVGNKIYGSHRTLIEFLTKILNVSPEIAEKDACKMEHTISRNTLRKLIAFVEFAETYPNSKKSKWFKNLKYYFKHRKKLKKRKKRKI